jgi:hypothetical protein
MPDWGYRTTAPAYWPRAGGVPSPLPARFALAPPRSPHQNSIMRKSAWWICLPRSIRAARAARIDHESRIHHDTVAKETDVRGVAPASEARGTLAREMGPGHTAPDPREPWRWLTRQAVRNGSLRWLGPRRPHGGDTGLTGIRSVGPAPGLTKRGIEHPFARVDLVAQAQDQRRELGGGAWPDPGAVGGQPVSERAAPAHRRPGDYLRNA